MTKIEQLKQAAGLYVDTSGRWANADGVDRLVELVVKETMQVVANQLPSNQYLDVAHSVIEHFGVEE
jgi:hypothetical protein